MCNTLMIHYTCNHYDQFHRSTCRSIFWVNKKANKNIQLPPPLEGHAEPSPERGRSLRRGADITPLSRSPSRRSKSPSPTPPKMVSKAACRSQSDVVLKAGHPCGPCTLIRRGLWSQRKARLDFPSRKQRKQLKRGKPVSGGSPLKHELKPEDLSIPDADTAETANGDKMDVESALVSTSAAL